MFTTMSPMYAVKSKAGPPKRSRGGGGGNIQDIYFHPGVGEIFSGY